MGIHVSLQELDGSAPEAMGALEDHLERARSPSPPRLVALFPSRAEHLAPLVADARQRFDDAALIGTVMPRPAGQASGSRVHGVCWSLGGDACEVRVGEAEGLADDPGGALERAFPSLPSTPPRPCLSVLLLCSSLRHRDHLVDLVTQRVPARTPILLAGPGGELSMEDAPVAGAGALAEDGLVVALLWTEEPLDFQRAAGEVPVPS